MIPRLWNWLSKNVNLVVLLSASICLALAVGQVLRGATWFLLMPVSLSAVLSGWLLAGSRINPKRAWVVLAVLGLVGIALFVAGLGRPLGRLIVSVFSLVPQVVLRVFDRGLVDFGPLRFAWTELANHVAGILSRAWVWFAAIFAGKTLIDPLVAVLVWNLVLWFVGAWAAWRLRRNHQVLLALAPGGIVMASVLDYVRGDVGLLILYLGCLLALMGIVGNEWRLTQWKRRNVDFSESIPLESLVATGMVTVALVLSAAGTPSISWRELVKKIRERDSSSEDRVAQSLGLQPSTDVAGSEAYSSAGLPRSHILTGPPELLQELVMTVSTGELPPVPENVPDALNEIHPRSYHWRTITYDRYSGVGWSSSQAREVLLPADTPLLDSPANYRLVSQHIIRNPDQGDSAYWTGILAQVDSDVEIAWRAEPPADPNPADDGDMLGALVNVDEYNVVSYVPRVSLSELRASGSDYPPQISNKYLELPESTPERVIALARQLTLASPTPFDRAVAIESYLRTFPYTLDVEPPPPGRDIADYFLFTAKKGYCDYYASSMVVLARAAGLPARLVIGYASGDYSFSTAEYVVRQKDAHSWVDIYFSGIGWVEFEPTANQPAIVREGTTASEPSPGLPGGLSALSWLKLQWYTLFSTLGGQLLTAGIGIILLLVLWQLLEVGRLYLLSPRKAVVLIYSRMGKVAMRMLPGLHPGYTPHQFQLALFARFREEKISLKRSLLLRVEPDVEHIISLFVAQVFSQHSPTRKQVNGGIRSWARVRWRLWVARFGKLSKGRTGSR